MKWFKHDANANADAKLKRLKMRFGMEGYGLYWYCLEIIAEGVDQDNFTFELEHDAEIIAYDTGLHQAHVEEIMRFMVELGLFESQAGKVTCLKMAKRLDQSMTSNPQMRKIITDIKKNHDSVNDKIMISSDQIRLDKIRKEKKICQVEPDAPPQKSKSDLKNTNNYKAKAVAVLEFLNEKCERSYRPTKTNLNFIVCRLREGYTEQQCRQVIAKKKREWFSNDKMREYLRPATLFNAEKFNQYVGELIDVKQEGFNYG